MTPTDSVNTTSADLLAERIEQLHALFPEAFTEGKVDTAKLRAALGDFGDERPERYLFTWAGKRDAIRVLQTPSHATLVPTPGESVDFDTTRNLFIEGDNLEVLKLLYKSYFGQVKLIYIDPPYNTGNDFVYPDNYTDPLDTYLQLTGQKDGNGNRLTSNAETNGRYHSAWLSMMYPRLFMARQLLDDDGVIFVSIDDHEIYNLRSVMNEIFGEENFIGTLIWKRRQMVDSRAKTGLSVDHEYTIAYRRNDATKLRGQEKDLTKYSNPDNDPRGPWASDNLVGLATREQRPNLHYDLIDPATGNKYPCAEAGWRYSRETMARLIQDGRIIWPASPAGRPRLRRYLNDLEDEFTGLSSVLTTAFSTQATRDLKEIFEGKDVLDFPKPVEYIKLLVQQAATPAGQDIVLDFFAGSCTTAQAVLELNREDGGNRRFICVQLPELLSEPKKLSHRTVLKTIADIGKERIRRVIAKMRGAQNGKLELKDRETPEDLGFKVFKLAPSNFRPFIPVSDAQAYLPNLEAHAKNPLIEAWTPENLTCEVAIKEGYGLSYRVEPVAAVTKHKVARVTDPDKEQSFYLCLDDKLNLKALKPLNLSRADLFICRKLALDDNTAANLALQCRLKAI